MSDSLAKFFAEIRPFLLGSQSAEEFEARVGASPSGRRRLAVYPRLVASDLTGVMEALYPAVKIAAGRLSPKLWPALLTEFARAHPPTHWDINVFGEPFSAFLSARRSGGAECPAFLEELADFEWTEYCAFVHPASEVPASGVNPTAQVRQYTHAVPRWARRCKSGEADGLPEPKPTTAIVFRDPETLRTRVFYPTMAALFALARAQKIGGRALVEASGVKTEDIDRAEEQLRREKILLEVMDS